MKKVKINIENVDFGGISKDIERKIRKTPEKIYDVVKVETATYPITLEGIMYRFKQSELIVIE
ncbi:hypothetical protein [Paenibacillus sp. XY044]|uniref:hypothetical protein n=1 Tax=Paenibacillus sp. XY044 TaxID=2026089 RepID=UPI000B97D8E1|nr:hypothetical protein [Paenibacillus sp. XY044]OZB98063.1 hypothetical protein CJP46_02535 [Paenibacillus sp. XY044]